MDVVVVGAGPAGLALAAAATGRGLRVQVVDPRAGQPWVPTYGSFVDDLPPDLRDLCAVTWARPLVLTDGHAPVVVPRAYGKVDGEALQQRLMERLRQAGGEVLQGRVAAVRVEEQPLGVELEDGSVLVGAVVVDATGGPGRFTQPGAGEPGCQVAHGELWEVDAHPWEADELVLMDFRTAHLPQDDVEGPSFLYALPLDAHHVFVEETSLVARPAMAPALLRRRLGQRMAWLGLSPRRVLAEEHCRIAMGGELPPADQPVLPFGAAAGLVHPATGYQLCRALHAAPRVADALAAHLPGEARQARAAAWTAMWPPELRRARELHLLGLDLLLGLESERLSAFMRCFCSLPARHQAAYMTGMGSHGAVMSAMSSLAPMLPMALVGELLSAIMGGGHRRIWSAVRPGLAEAV